MMRTVDIASCMFLYSSAIWMFPKIVGFPPKSSILLGFSIMHHPFGDTPIFGNTHIFQSILYLQRYTPKDFSMEPENTGPLEKENFPNHQFQVLC